MSNRDYVPSSCQGIWQFRPFLSDRFASGCGMRTLRQLHQESTGSQTHQTVFLVAIAAMILMGVRLTGESWSSRTELLGYRVIHEDATSVGGSEPGSPPEWQESGAIGGSGSGSDSKSIDISHPVTLFPQPTNMTCWSAAASMLFGNQSVGPGDASLDPSGGLVATFENVQKFADAHGLQMHSPQSWTVQGLADLLRNHGPLWVAGFVPSGHAFVISGMHGDGTPDGTTLTIYDPWPPGVGAIKKVNLAAWIKKYPEATTYILHR